MHTEFWWRNLTGDHLENLGVIERIILKWFIGSRIGADWINGAADTDKWWAVVKAVINFWAPWNVGNYLTSWEAANFPGMTQDVTHWIHVLDSVSLKHPAPNQNKLPTLYPPSQSKQTSHTLPPPAPWVRNTDWPGEFRNGATLHHCVCLSVCLSVRPSVRVQCRTNYAEPFQHYYNLRSLQSQLTV